MPTLLLLGAIIRRYDDITGNAGNAFSCGCPPCLSALCSKIINSFIIVVVVVVVVGVVVVVVVVII